ncbi:hypothetical protein WR25_21603 [Diploscapter pachys]|uniref:Uncharacterized protein n=1 Tax=Diploscapter pachys TaxID=2018661 RepID=A0A2A2KAH6_9BILA|nr:hypothetical protein WR25_21603 [Diploscapter pachys]
MLARLLAPKTLASPPPKPRKPAPEPLPIALLQCHALAGEAADQVVACTIANAGATGLEPKGQATTTRYPCDIDLPGMTVEAYQRLQRAAGVAAGQQFEVAQVHTADILAEGHGKGLAARRRRRIRHDRDHAGWRAVDDDPMGIANIVQPRCQLVAGRIVQTRAIGRQAEHLDAVGIVAQGAGAVHATDGDHIDSPAQRLQAAERTAGRAGADQAEIAEGQVHGVARGVDKGRAIGGKASHGDAVSVVVTGLDDVLEHQGREPGAAPP